MGLFGFFIRTAWASGGDGESPETRPFVDPLYVPPVLEPASALDPAPAECPVAGEAERPCHQGWRDYPPRRQYHTHATEALWRFHSDLPQTRIWGYDGGFPGPTIDARYGEPIVVRIHNELPSDHTGFGIPEMATHLHNAHTPSESDGFAADYYGSGLFKDHHYPNILAGGDPREALGTLWMHDHRMFFTGPNVYRGLFRFYRLFDSLDSGDETDPEGLGLPSGPYDVPLGFTDKRFDRDGQLVLDQFEFDGFLGDKFCVNGKIQPYFNVARRKYRFRMLDASPSRFYEFFLVHERDTDREDPDGEPMILIGNDGNLLPRPYEVRSIRLGVAERADVVIDFSRFEIGDRLYLVNRLEQDDGRGPDDDLRDLDESDFVMEFRVDRDASDPSRVPDTLRELPPVNLSEVVRERVFVFERENGGWAINDRFFDPDRPVANVQRGTAELWTIRNNSGGWHHPVHIHLEEAQVLEINGRKPRHPQWLGRKDVFRLGPNDEVKLFYRFRTWLGRYPIHCHNTMHEDHAMMARWDMVV